MKNQLQLQEIAGYLPYGLKGVYTLSDVVNTWKDEQRDKILTAESCQFFFLYCKPILRPMSDLNDSTLMKVWLKEHSIEKNIMGLRLVTKDAWCIDILGYPLQFITDLYREHFDIHNLIGRGLAISIHDIPTK